MKGARVAVVAASAGGNGGQLVGQFQVTGGGGYVGGRDTSFHMESFALSPRGVLKRIVGEALAALLVLLPMPAPAFLTTCSR